MRCSECQTILYRIESNSGVWFRCSHCEIYYQMKHKPRITTTNTQDPVCDSCLDAIWHDDTGLMEDMEQEVVSIACREMGDMVADHICDTVEPDSGRKECLCACQSTS